MASHSCSTLDLILLGHWVVASLSYLILFEPIGDTSAADDKSCLASGFVGLLNRVDPRQPKEAPHSLRLGLMPAHLFGGHQEI